MKRKLGLLLFLTCLLSVLFMIFRSSDKWEKYYQNKLYRPPHKIVQSTIQKFKIPGTAIDLGCGVGNETAFLLRNGWKVWAVDNHAKAIQMLKRRDDIDSFEGLITIKAEFDHSLDWNHLPSVDLIYACYALPFCRPEQFEYTWEHIKEKILPGGWFVGHFFGLNYQGFSEKEKKDMVFLTKEKIYSLFDGFTIESFQEEEEDTKSGTGRVIHSHIFEVMAKKRNQELT